MFRFLVSLESEKGDLPQIHVTNWREPIRSKGRTFEAAPFSIEVEENFGAPGDEPPVLIQCHVPSDRLGKTIRDLACRYTRARVEVVPASNPDDTILVHQGPVVVRPKSA